MQADAELDGLVERARETALNSYSPYSGFRVGAALKLTDGQIVTGTNVENVSYGLTICAERSALVRARSRSLGRISALPQSQSPDLNGAA